MVLTNLLTEEQQEKLFNIMGDVNFDNAKDKISNFLDSENIKYLSITETSTITDEGEFEILYENNGNKSIVDIHLIYA